MIAIEKNQDITTNFIKWLISELKKEIMLKVNLKRLQTLSTHINEVFDTDINISKVFIELLQNITFYESDDFYIILIDPIKKFNGILLVDFYQYINFGDLQFDGYPIMHQILSNVNLKLNKYLLKYRLVGVI